MAKTLVKLTFAALPEVKYDRRSLAVSVLCNVCIIGTLMAVSLTAGKKIMQTRRYDTITLYAPVTPPKIKIIVPPTPKIRQSDTPMPVDRPLSEIVKTQSLPKIQVRKQEPPPAIDTSKLDVPPPDLTLSSHRTSVKLALQPKAAMPAYSGTDVAARQGQVAAAGFGTSQNQKQQSVRTGTVGWPSGGAMGRVQQVTAPAYKPMEVLGGPLPEYSPEAKQLHITGNVVLKIEVSSTGKVTILDVVHGLGHGLDEAARRAVEHYKIKPAVRNGVPVDETTTITVRFQISA